MPLLTTKKETTRPRYVGKGLRRGKVPVKRTINLAAVDEKKINWLLFFPLFLLILVFAAAFGKFLVYDRLEAVNTARREVAALQTRLNESMAVINEEAELNELYAHYTYSGMTEEELSLVSRVDVMELLQRVVSPRTELDSWNLKANELTLSIDGDSLQEINMTAQALMQEPVVDYCTVTNARTVVPDERAYAEAVQTAIRNGTEPPEPAMEYVNADIVIYLRNPEEATEE